MYSKWQGSVNIGHVTVLHTSIRLLVHYDTIPRHVRKINARFIRTFPRPASGKKIKFYVHDTCRVGYPAVFCKMYIRKAPSEIPFTYIYRTQRYSSALLRHRLNRWTALVQFLCASPPYFLS